MGCTSVHSSSFVVHRLGELTDRPGTGAPGDTAPPVLVLYGYNGRLLATPAFLGYCFGVGRTFSMVMMAR